MQTLLQCYSCTCLISLLESLPALVSCCVSLMCLPFLLRLGKLATLRGTVVRMSPIRPLITEMDFVCSKCNTTQRCKFPDGKYTMPVKCTGGLPDVCQPGLDPSMHVARLCPQVMVHVRKHHALAHSSRTNLHVPSTLFWHDSLSGTKPTQQLYCLSCLAHSTLLWSAVVVLLCVE